MALINCDKHGIQGAELVSPMLQNIILNKNDCTGRIHEISLKFEGLEFPRFITSDEIKEMGLEKKFSNGVIEFENEHDAEMAIGLFVPACLKCVIKSLAKPRAQEELRISKAVF